MEICTYQKSAHGMTDKVQLSGNGCSEHCCARLNIGNKCVDRLAPGRIAEIEGSVSFRAEEARQSSHAAPPAKNSVQKNDAFIAQD